MAKLTTLEDDNRSISHRTSTVEFAKKDGIKYCNNCGKECLSEDICCANCGKDKFLSEKISNIIGGYIKLAKDDVIKKYYSKNFNSNSVIKMNEKRIIHQLLKHKDKIEVRKEIVDKIYNLNIK